ncbi:hypothetical protein B7Y94_01200 [Candidatus Saccharibacteria bacterium 32-49-12]|nr:MAG: hypothetical protein B7Y94_01200 [Candidatus Saccharibacteria bacterium 32-49-12]
MSEKTSNSERFAVLDWLRGYFIIVIIVDHLSRWPSIWSTISGKAWLWVTAAEGFIIISGLLVGYIRGYKKRFDPMNLVTKSLLKRALTLYIWAVLGTIVYTTLIWYLPLIGGAPGMPVSRGDWSSLIGRAVILDFTYVWVYFLKLYAVFLAFAPIAVWLLRRSQAGMLMSISTSLLMIGWATQNELLQWQFLFFIPSMVGYHLDEIINWWRRTTSTIRASLSWSVIGLSLVTIVLSVLATFHQSTISSLASALNPLFEKDTISLARAGMAFLWFSGLLLIFIKARHFIARWLAWLIEPIGRSSLTAYILHGMALITISSLTASGSNILINSALGAAAVLIVWSLLKIPRINRVIPR